MVQTNSFNKNIELDQKQIILQQILTCNRTISGFNAFGKPIHAQIEEYDYMEASQQGKAVANSILALEANVFPLFTKEFLNRQDIAQIRDKAFLSIKDFIEIYSQKEQEENSEETIRPLTRGYNNNSPKRRYEGKLYMCTDLDIQQNGIENLIEYYRYLLAYIYSLPDFKTVRVVGEQTKDEDEIEEGFETE